MWMLRQRTRTEEEGDESPQGYLDSCFWKLALAAGEPKRAVFRAPIVESLPPLPSVTSPRWTIGSSLCSCIPRRASPESQSDGALLPCVCPAPFYRTLPTLYPSLALPLGLKSAYCFLQFCFCRSSLSLYLVPSLSPPHHQGL